MKDKKIIQTMRVLIVILSFNISSVFSQTPFLDSLKASIDFIETDTGKIAAMSRYAWELKDSDLDSAFDYNQKVLKLARLKNANKILANALGLNAVVFQRRNQIDSSNYYFRQAIDWGKQINYPKGVGNSLHNLGTNFMRLGKFVESRTYFHQAFKYYQKAKNNSGMAVSLSSLAASYGSVGNNEQAAKYLIEANETCAGQCKPQFLVSIYVNLAMLYREQKAFDKSLQYYQKVYKIALERENILLQAISFKGKAGVYQSLDSLDLAIEHFEASLELFQKIKMEPEIANSYASLGLIYKIKENFDVALDYYLKSIRTEKEIGLLSTSNITYNNIGTLYCQKEEFQQALPFFQKSIELSEQRNANDVLVETYFGIANTYAAIKEYKLAHKWMSKHVTLKDSLFNIEKEVSTDNLLAKYEAVKKEKQLMAQQLKLKEQEARNQRNIGLLIVAVLVICLLLFAFKNMQKKKQFIEKSKQLLEISNQELQSKLDTPQELLKKSLTLTNKEKEIIPLKDIIYLKAEKNAVQIFTNDKKYWEWQSMKTMRALLPDNIFLSTHRSYLINVFEVRNKKAKNLTMSNGDVVKIGNTMQDQVHTFLDNQPLLIT